MTEDQDKDKTAAPEADPSPPDLDSSGPGEEEAPGEAAAEPETESSPEIGSAPAASAPKSFGISDDLRQALEEAEASINKRVAKPAGNSAEIEIDLEAATDEEGEDAEFDPNRVDEDRPAPAPRVPSPEELELKKQVLELRYQLRDAQIELDKRLKDFKQNAEQARMLKQQFDTYKGRVQREKADWFNYGHEPILKEILQVLDNLERALGHAGQESDVGAIREGVEMILRQFESVLGKFGVSPVAAEGQPFNPEFHQAMMQVENSDLPPGAVVEVHQKGYLLKDRLLRPAMVTVSKRPAGAAAPAAAPESGPADQAPQDQDDGPESNE